MGSQSRTRLKRLSSSSNVNPERGGKEIPLVQGKEQRLCFAGAAVKRYPTRKFCTDLPEMSVFFLLWWYHGMVRGLCV
ncbi:hypothetical protein CapIbe_000083 [Capra ibex]